MEKAITQKDTLLLYINVCVMGYILSPNERAWGEEGRRRSNSPPPFTPAYLEVTVAALAKCLHHIRRNRTGNSTSLSLLIRTQELDRSPTFPAKGTTAKVSYQRTKSPLAKFWLHPLQLKPGIHLTPQVQASSVPTIQQATLVSTTPP